MKSLMVSFIQIFSSWFAVQYQVTVSVCFKQAPGVSNHTLPDLHRDAKSTISAPEMRSLCQSEMHEAKYWRSSAAHAVSAAAAWWHNRKQLCYAACGAKFDASHHPGGWKMILKSFCHPARVDLCTQSVLAETLQCRQVYYMVYRKRY